MIAVSRSKRGLPYVQKWFAREVRAADRFSLVAYFQYLGDRPPALFFKRPFVTLLVDLGMGPEAILAGMHRNVRNEIRRAENEGIAWEERIDTAGFLDFHGRFSREKGIDAVTESQLSSFGDAIFLTRVSREDRVLAQHAYVVDREERRARFLYSSSGRFDGADSALVGRANRWGHWKDMLHFHRLGMETYDLGGIAIDPEDPALRGINEFKSKLGGRTVREDHWFSAPYVLATRLTRWGTR